MPVHLIRGGYANTYLIEDRACLVAVDVGTPAAAKQIHLYLSHKSIDASSLKMVTATHFHIDHVAGISKLVELFPEARICFFTMVGCYLKRKDKICLFPPSLWLKRLLPVFMVLGNHTRNTAAALTGDKVGIPLPLLRIWLRSHYTAECTLEQGKQIPSLPNWDLIETPGHTHDSICFYNRHEKTLISGDTILNLTGCGELNTFCCDGDAIKESFKKLSRLSIRHIYPGHGEPLLELEGFDRIIQ
jgi:hydroxyacylglutathione hydrolase